MPTNYQVLARKWRPKQFSQLVGQYHVVKALENSLQNNRVHHAYLFTGTRGVGKTTIARILAKCLLCEVGPTKEPCSQCKACESIDNGNCLDLIEIDAASRTKVEDTREILENIQYIPALRFKILVIDEVHMLSNHSFNALLKTLEEPPPHVKFLLATTDPQKLPATVLSRCLQFHLKSLSPEQIAKHLEYILQEEKISHEINALEILSLAASGSLRDALSLLDQAIAYTNANLLSSEVRTMLGCMEQTQLIGLIKALSSKDTKELANCIQELSEKGIDFLQATDDLLTLLHHIALTQLLPQALPQHLLHKLEIEEIAQRMSPEDIQLFYQIALINRRDLMLSPSPRIGFEVMLLRMLAFQPKSEGSKPRTTSKPSSVSTETSSPLPLAANPKISQNWEEMVKHLKLNGITQILATHCVMTDFTKDSIHLMLDINHATLLNDKQKERLTMAIQNYLGNSLQVNISIGKSQELSPAAISIQQKQEHQKMGQEILQKDENMQAILQQFNATIVPNSIKLKSEDLI